VKLLAIGHSYVLGVNRAILRALADEHAFNVTVGAPQHYAGDLRPLRCEPEPDSSALRVVPLRMRASGFPHVSWYSPGALRRLLEEDDYAVVSIWEEPFVLSGFQVAMAARRHSLARLCFYSCQNLSKVYPPPFSWFERQTVSWADGWCAAGELVKETLSQRGYDPTRGEVLPLAVDTSLFRPRALEERHKHLHELGLEPPVIGFVGRLVKAKGIKVLTEALGRIPADQPWSALFLGSGPEAETIRSWAQERNVSGRVCVQLVRHDEVPRYMGAMDVLAVPSRTTPRWKEQFGRVIVEAFACGVPVVASDSGEIPHVVGDAGIVVPEDDTARWAAELAALLADPERRAQLIERGRERAQLLSAPALAVRYATFYRSLTAREKVKPLSSVLVGAHRV
jgi:glycosyltransferase involved in cell wall biosynthesis